MLNKKDISRGITMVVYKPHKLEIGGSSPPHVTNF